MNNINDRLFSCLLRDLGYSQRCTVTVEQLSNLRKELLQLSELEFEASALDTWNKKWNDLFTSSKTLADVRTPIEFRDRYQVLSFRLKIKETHTHDQEIEYIGKFKANEEKTRAWLPNRSNPVSRLARFITRCSTSSGLDLSRNNIARYARQGPGAVFDGTTLDDKSWYNTRYRSLERFLPDDWWFSNHDRHLDCLSDAQKWESCDQIVARLALVPKDWKGPRGVFVSPKEAMFCQLGIDGAFKDWLRNSMFRSCYDPQSQLPSQEAAWEGSYARYWSTLDLSDASDLIPLRLISYLFHREDYLAIARTRPSRIILPSGEVWKLAMCSPMGDGKTFSVLTTVCIVLTIAAMLHQDGWLAARPPCGDLIASYAEKVRVFGDDIAVDSRYFDAVCKALEEHNLKVNYGKSFSRGFFRESCGLDAFQGTDVTPLRQKVNLDQDPQLDELVSFYNRIKTRYPHLKATNALVLEIVESLYGPLPFTSNCEMCPFMLQAEAGTLYVQNSRKGIKYRVGPTHRLQVLAYTGRRTETYPDPLDDRYRLNTSLWANNYRPSAPNGGAIRPAGSPQALDYLRRQEEYCGLPRFVSIPYGPRAGFRRGWVDWM